MDIKRTIKDGYADAGKVEIIGDARMENIIRQTRLSNTPAREKGMTGTDEVMLRLKEGVTIETFYAVYEPMPN